ncbi:MAG: DUF6273 domain-containing protein [Eubacteriales bacterium]|nr:DUF6273 domain-containing protein [Eubacteriales bacterium]
MKKKNYVLSMIMMLVVLICFVFSGCGQQSVGSDSDSEMIGEHMKFGTYQGEEIEWRVIDADDKNGKLLLLSEYGLDAKPYHEDSTSDIDWEDCTLRQWLNGEFYESVFTDAEKEEIVLSTSEGFPEHNSRVPGREYIYLERETEDNIFLLSYTEVYHYISNETGDETNPARLCYPTEYAKNNSDIHIYNDTCGWWLGPAHQGYSDKHDPVVVSSHGAIHVEDDADSREYAVRPAMWIKWQREK